MYAEQLLQLSDCVVPDVMPSAIAADYMRRCFYALDKMDVREYAMPAYGGTVGGTRWRVGYDEDIDYQGHKTVTTYSDSAACPASFSLNSNRANGYWVDVNGWYQDKGYAYVFSDNVPAT